MDPLHSWSHPALRMTWRAVWDIRPVTGRGISPTFMASPVTLRPVQGGRNWVSRWYPWSDFEMLRRLLQHILHDLSSTKRVSWHIVFFFLIFFAAWEAFCYTQGAPSGNERTFVSSAIHTISINIQHQAELLLPLLQILMFAKTISTRFFF